MLELNIKCDSVEEARVYLNAQQYLNLITDFAEALRNAEKYSDNVDQAMLLALNGYKDDFRRAAEHHTGAY
jgi:hypothetical protein